MNYSIPLICASPATLNLRSHPWVWTCVRVSQTTLDLSVSRQREIKKVFLIVMYCHEKQQKNDEVYKNLF